VPLVVIIADTEEYVATSMSKRGFHCERFSKAEMRSGKTPDFRVFIDGEFSFFLEVKEVQESASDSGAREDPVFNRLTDDIHTATKQFKAVNTDHEHPNVLAIVNNDVQCGSLDLVGVVTGNLLLEGGEKAPIYTKYACGRINKDLKQIDLIAWFDARKAKADPNFFIGPPFCDYICKVFEVDPLELPRVGT
jgi:hypothetical protein